MTCGAQTAGGALPLSAALTWACLLLPAVREQRKVGPTEGKRLALGTAAMGLSGLWAGASTGPVRGHPGPLPARPFRPIFQFLSFTFNSFDIWKADPTRTHNSCCQASEEGSLFISIPYQASVSSRSPWGPSGNPYVLSTHRHHREGGKRAPAACGDRPDLSWVLVVKDGPWGRRTRLVAREAHGSQG